MYLILVIALLAPNDRAAFEKQILTELEAAAPAAVEPFQRAERERAAGKLQAAVESYKEVIALVPRFDHAFRRLCQVHAELGRRRIALEACRSAVEARQSSDNYATLAMVLVNAGRDKTSFAIDEAKQAALLAVKLGPDSVSAHTVLCHVAAMSDDHESLGTCSTRLATLAPDDPLTHTFATILAIAEKRWSDARSSLERAKSLGMATATYQELKAAIAPADPAWKRLLRRWWWLGAAVLLLALGVFVWRRRGTA